MNKKNKDGHPLVVVVAFKSFLPTSILRLFPFCVVILSYDKRGDREIHFDMYLKNSNYL